MASTAVVDGQLFNDIELIGSGWKTLSMVDVLNSISFTLWLCGCNLKCPFCHNWKLATWSKDRCVRLNINLLFEELSRSTYLVDYLHVTGGEPLIQWRNLASFFKKVKENISTKISLNTNLTLYKPLAHMLSENLLDHIATDIKSPPQLLYGHDPNISLKLWLFFLDSLSLIAEYDIDLELRIPVIKNINLDIFKKNISDVLKRLEKHNSFYIVIQPLLGPPVTDPRDYMWCNKYCNPERTELEIIKQVLVDEYGIVKVFIKHSNIV
ncbi:MAG: anaerobic ribonucleoside-triphosphate reductase activating protein [Desulfurococcales archaeon]|nr:anaerobic ribonucleoside-triphosphate reductase activating protein [Desulfurococcales archaeon]